MAVPDKNTQLGTVEYTPHFSLLFEDESEQAQRIGRHKAWLQSIRHERPNPNCCFKIGIYIRYFNQTKYENYLSYHKKQFSDTISLCPNWTLIDFYVDNGSSTPNMENAPEWSRLLNDCYENKVDLIITQKISNISKNIDEITICARLLAAHDPPIGIYFVSEDVFTLASYYMNDLYDSLFLPKNNSPLLEDKNIGEK